MIAVDANILAYLYLPTEHTAQVEALLEKDPDWVAPLLWRSEFRNVMAGCIRRKDLTFDAARSLQAEAEALMSGNEHDVDSRHVLELVRDSDCSAYDCEYIALAQHLGVKLVTMDSKLLKAFPRQAVSIARA